MPTEAELRDLLHGEDPEPGALNTARIIRQAKARRRPKQFAAGLTGGIAAVGALAFVLPAALGMGGTGLSTAGGSAADQAGADDTSTLKEYDAPESATTLLSQADGLNLCGAPAAQASHDPAGLVLAVGPVTSPAAVEWIATTVTLTNTGEDTVSTAGTPVVAFVGDGTVLWHGASTSAMSPTELGPGDSASFAVEFRPVSCTPADDAAGSPLPTGLPAAAPGDYQVTAAIDVVSADAAADAAVRTVVAPPAAVALR